jgi:hypothetical protein
MATVQEIIDYAELAYPRVADISDANKIVVLNQIMEEIYNKILRVRWEYDYDSTNTVADQASYVLPADCKPDNIIKVMVSQDEESEIDTNTEWDEFTYIGLLDDYDISSGNFYTCEDDVIYLFKDGEPISQNSLVFKLYYFRDPSKMISVSETPEVEAKYHNLFKYGLIQFVASIGDNPEIDIANYWQAKYDEEMVIAIKNINDKFNSAPLQSRQVKEYW